MNFTRPLLFIFRCKTFFTTMIYKLGIHWIHLRIYDKLCLLSGLISAHRRESWVGVTLASWLYKTGRLASSRRQLRTGCSLQTFVGSS